MKAMIKAKKMGTMKEKKMVLQKTYRVITMARTTLLQSTSLEQALFM